MYFIQKYKKIIFLADIAGNYNFLIKIKQLFKYYKIIVAGDLIDRGKDSKRVLDLLISGKIIGVKGNHEDLFIDFYRNKAKKYSKFCWLTQGGYETILSFLNSKDKIIFEKMYEDVKESKKISKKDWDLFHKFVIDRIDEKYIVALENLPLYIEGYDFICSHNPLGKHPLDYREETLLWRRNKPLNVFKDKIQIFGHNCEEDVVAYSEDNNEVYSICLDSSGGEYLSIYNHYDKKIYQWDEESNKFITKVDELLIA